MISFELTEEQQHWQEKARDFAEKEIKPLAWKIDRGLTQEFHWPLIKKMAEQDLLSLGMPSEYGGSDLDFLTTGIVIEELAVADIGIAFTAGMNAATPLSLMGTEEQKKKFLPLTCDRKNPGLAGFALTEPNAGSDAGAVSTQARREGDEYVLNGEKCFISSGDMAALYVVFATVDKSKGVGGITGFLLPGDTEGISRGKIEDKMGFHSNHTGVVVLNDVRIPVEDRLGEEGSGFMIAMKLLEIARVISCGVVGVGLARGAYETTLKFLKTHSDAKTLMMQQPISFDLADMLASIEATRLLVWKACWMLDNELPSGAMSALTKFYASDMALEIANKGMQLVGPHAYTEEYHLDKLVRDAKLLQIYEGTNQISRLVVSRDILSR